MSKSHRPLVILLSLVIVGSWAAAAWAQEEVKGAAKPGPAAAAPQTIKVGEAQKLPAGKSAVSIPLTDEQKALLAIQEEGRQQVLDLMRALEAMPDGPARVAMEKKIVQVKQDNLIHMLRTKVDFARVRGDFKAVQQGEMVIDNILHPRTVPNAAAIRPAPDKTTDK